MLSNGTITIYRAECSVLEAERILKDCILKPCIHFAVRTRILNFEQMQ